MIRKLFRVSAVTLLLALSLVSLTTTPVLAQGTGEGAKTPGVDLLNKAFPSSGGAPSINGSSPLQNDDVFERAKVSNDLGFMKDMWGLTRKLTNVMVVVFLFIAAAATTLNFQVSTYGIKKTLPSVLLATLYANFSYAIAQLFNSVNMAFLKAFTGSATSAMSLMSNFIKGPLDHQYSQIRIENGWGGNMMALLVLAIMAVLAVGLLVLVLLFVVRNYFLAMLIAIAPLAFMCLAMPFTQGAFKKWWDQFIRWMFFPAIAGFWLYMGGVALTAAGISGGLIGIVMAGLILWVAIRTPFTIGAGVAAAAGFITGYATRGLGMAGRATKATGKFAANTTLGGTWDQIRLRTAAGYEQTLLGRAARGRRQARTRLEKNVELERGRAAWTPTQMRHQRNPFLRLNNMFQNYMATNVASMEADLAVKEGRNKRETATGQRNAGATAAGQRRATLSANDKIEADVAETQFKQAQLAAEVEARRNNPLSLALGHAQEAVAGLEDSIAGITALYKKQALEEGETLRQLRRIGIARKALGEQAYQREMGQVKLEARRGSDALVTALGNELEQAMGRGFTSTAGGLTPQSLRKAMAQMSGDSQDVEETIKSIAERDASLFQVRKLSADESIDNANARRTTGSAAIVNHNFADTDAYTTALSNAGAIITNPDGSHTFARNAAGRALQIAGQQMGIGHLSTEQQIEAIRDLTHTDNREIRDASRINGLKARGASSAKAATYIESEASEQTANVTIANDAARIGEGLRAMRNAGASSVVNSGRVLNNPESDVEMAGLMRAVDQMHGRVARFKKQQGAQIVPGFNSFMTAMGPVLVEAGYATSAARAQSRLENLAVRLPTGNRDTVNSILTDIQNGNPITNSTSGTPIGVQDLSEAVKQAIINETSSYLRLGDASTSAVWTDHP